MSPEERAEIKAAIDKRRRELCGIAPSGGGRIQCEAYGGAEGRRCRNRALPGRRFCGLHRHVGGQTLDSVCHRS